MLDIAAALVLLAFLGFIFSWTLFGDRKKPDFHDLDF